MIGDIALLMCSHPDRAGVLSTMVAHPDFTRNHRQCLTYLADTGWGTP